MAEEWRAVPGFDGYEVSNQGRVRGWKHRYGVRNKPHEMKLQVDYHGYVKAYLVRDGVQRPIGVHRLVAAAFIGPCPTGLQVNHRDGCKANNAPENLEYVTPSENVKHRFDVLGQRVISGEEVYNAKFTHAQVRAIRKQYAGGQITMLALAEEYGTNPSRIWKIVHREVYKEA